MCLYICMIVFSKETSSTTFQLYSCFIRRFISNWSFNASNTVQDCACLYRYLHAYSLYNGGGSRFNAVHVCACTYMHAAQGQAYIYRYIYAFGGSLLAISWQKVFLFMSAGRDEHIWKLKDEGTPYNITWTIKRRAQPYSPGSKKCSLCRSTLSSQQTERTP